MGMKKMNPCTHPGPYHLGSDGLSIIKPHPQADSCFAREQGYVIAKVEPSYRELAPAIVEAMNARVADRGTMI
jgi:hypothetical protein